MELPKILVWLYARNFKRAEGIPRFEEVKVKSCGTTKCSWMQGIRLGNLWNYQGWLNASEGRCVDQGSSGALDLIGFVLSNYSWQG